MFVLFPFLTNCFLFIGIFMQKIYPFIIFFFLNCEGNAMGYVRLVRSGGLHCSSKAARFIPDLQDVVSFVQLCEDASVSTGTTRAAENLDAVISNLTRNFNQDTDYFKVGCVNLFLFLKRCIFLLDIKVTLWIFFLLKY